jgi:general secretion pathway protein C
MLRSSQIKKITDYFLSQNRFVTLCELGLVVILAVSMGNLVILALNWEKSPDNESASKKSLPNLAEQISNNISFSGTTKPTSKMYALFGTSIAAQQRDSSDESEELEETQLNLKLKGILMNSESGIRLALIARPSTTEEIYRVGDEIEGAEIIRIEPRRVVIRRNGNTEAINLEIPIVESEVVNKTRRKATIGRNGIGKVGENDRVVSQQTLRQQLNNLPRLLRQAKAIPHSVNGENMGFKVVEIQDGSIFQDLGLKQEDVIRSVNGTPIRTAEDALNAYRKLRTSNSFQLDLLRSGRAMTLNLSVQ